ncbi:MAG: hypothetical protein K8M05_08080 [Deltaproteobacteria bacterium]|nr:hypothetical protein [Kofleriaceae bacterium]
MRTRGLVAMLLVTTLHAGACSDTPVDELENACDDYCTLVMRNCQGAVAQYSDQSTCMATCRAMEVGTPGARDGNTIACRTFWAAIAEGEMAECTSAGPGGDGTCGTNCESFCNATLAICADQNNPPYASSAECTTACGSFSAAEPFDASDIAGDTLACRIYHMTAASTDPDTHCQHTGVASVTCI